MGTNLGDERSVQRCCVMSCGGAPKGSTSVQVEKSQSCVTIPKMLSRYLFNQYLLNTFYVSKNWIYREGGISCKTYRRKDILAVVFNRQGTLIYWETETFKPRTTKKWRHPPVM